jgi:GNAT superfamily N-acetyltransferase
MEEKKQVHAYPVISIILDNREGATLEFPMDTFVKMKQICSDNEEVQLHVQVLYNYWFNKDVPEERIKAIDLICLVGNQRRMDNSLIFVLDESCIDPDVKANINNIIGFASYYVNSADSSLYISRIHTLPEKRRQKVGTILIKALLMEAEKTKMNVHVDVLPTQEALTFFTKCNFICKPDPGNMTEEDALLSFEMYELIYSGKYQEVIQGEKYKHLRNKDGSFRMLHLDNE